jgi:hypothetical protein
MRSIGLSNRQRLRTRAAFALFGLAAAVPVGTLSATPAAAATAPPPTLSVNDVSVAEGNPGAPQQFAVFTVSLSSAQSAAISFRATTANGTGANPAIAGSDYTAVTTTGLIPGGATSTTVRVPILADRTFEPNETFTLNLSGSIVTIIRPTGTGTIVNDDPFPALRINNTSVAEGNSGTTTANLTVSLSNPASQPVTYRVTTVNGPLLGGARSGEDYNGFTNVLTMAPGQVSQNVAVAIRGDNKFEPAEEFFVDLSGAVNATIADGRGVVVIRNDDPVPTISIQNAAVVEGNAGTTTARLRVTLSNPTSNVVSVRFATANGSAVAPSDYASNSGTLTLAPGATSGTIAVAVNGDTVREPNEIANVVLSSPVNAILGNAVGVLTITNDDP